MSNKTLRQVTRLVHTLAGISFPLLVYSPLGDSSAFLTFNRVLLVPTVVLSGVLMWQPPRVSKWLKARA